MPSLPGEVTQLLIKWNQGDQAALDQLIPLVYSELKRLAKRHMGKERLDHTLQTSALINEAYLRLIDQQATPGRTASTSSPSPPRSCATS